MTPHPDDVPLARMVVAFFREFSHELNANVGADPLLALWRIETLAKLVMEQAEASPLLRAHSDPQEEVPTL